jgi:anti-sigma B factor antagonist
MSLEIGKRELEGITILDLRGRLTFGKEDLRLREEIEKLVQEKDLKVAMNLGELDQIDTAGLGTLLFAQETLQDAGGKLALAVLKPAHIEALTQAKLGVEFQIFESDLHAVNSFFPGREVHHFDVLEFVKRKVPKSEKL